LLSLANSVRRRCGFMLLVLLLAGCQMKSRWADLKIEALAYVDGRQVKSSTLWRMRSVEGFPPGARIEGSGVALAIPVAPGRYVYGLIRSLLRDDNLASWDAIPTGVDASVDRGGRLRRTRSEKLNFSETHDRVIEAIRGRDLEICLLDERRVHAQDRCLVFVYFTDPRNPATLKLVRPNVEANLDGRRFRLARVTATYREPGEQSMSQVAQLPSFVRKPDGRGFGVLPEGLKIDADRPLTRSDFWSKP